MTVTQDWLGAVLGAGGVAFAGALFKGLQMLRDGALARERQAIAGLEKWREDSDKRAARALAQADYWLRVTAFWQARNGTLEYLMGQGGIPVPPLPPLPEPPEEDDHDRAPAVHH